jgi:hypothetical protein
MILLEGRSDVRTISFSYDGDFIAVAGKDFFIDVVSLSLFFPSITKLATHNILFGGCGSRRYQQANRSGKSIT